MPASRRSGQRRRHDLTNLLDRIAAGTLRAEVVGVVGSRPGAYGLTRAAAAGVPTLVAGPAPAADLSARAFDFARHNAADLVILAGWLQFLQVPDDFRHRVLNIHPSLLPAFGGHGMYGRHVHEAVHAAGVKVSGCTVHLVDGDYDTGPIIAQHAVNLPDTADPTEIARVVFTAECETYPTAIEHIASGGWRVEGRRVVFGFGAG